PAPLRTQWGEGGAHGLLAMGGSGVSPPLDVACVAAHLTLPLLCNGSLPLPPKRAYRIHTSWLRSGRKTDSVIPLASDGVGHGIGVWAGAVWRPPPAKRGACLHEALVARPGSCIRRLGGTRSREMRFTRFLRNAAVTADEMSRHAGALTAERVAGREVVAIQDTSELV